MEAARRRKDATQKVSDAEFRKHVFGRERKNKLALISNFDPRPEEYKGTANDGLDILMQSMREMKLTSGLSVLLDPSCRSEKDRGMVFSDAEIFQKVEAPKLQMSMTPDERDLTEASTRGQSLNEEWHKAREHRITASVFGDIVSRKPSTKPDALVTRIIKKGCDLDLPALRYGREMEMVALQLYVSNLNIKGHPGLSIEQCGFFVSLTHPFLGTSPDAIVNDPVFPDPSGFAEVKCTFKYRHLTPEEASTKPDFCCEIFDGRPHLKKKHKYYAQVQGQMAIGGKGCCDFIIYTEMGLSVERIPFSEEFWQGKALPKLVEFFECCVGPEIVDPMSRSGKPMRDLRHATSSTETS